MVTTQLEMDSTKTKSLLQKEIFIPTHFEEYTKAILAKLDADYKNETCGNVYVSGSTGLGKSIADVFPTTSNHVR